MTSMRTLRRRDRVWLRYLAATAGPARRRPPGSRDAWLALIAEAHRSEMRAWARWRRTGGEMPYWLAGGAR